MSWQHARIGRKRAGDPYRSGRTQSWFKSKCGMEQEFVIIGWRTSDKSGRPFSSLLLAVRDDGELRYCGRVGTGYSGSRLDDLAAQFKNYARRPFSRAEACGGGDVSRLNARRCDPAREFQGAA